MVIWYYYVVCGFLLNTLFHVSQIYWCMSKEELLFSDFSECNIEEDMNIEEGAEYNKVPVLLVGIERHKTLLKL